MKNHRKVGVANDIRDLLRSMLGQSERGSRAGFGEATSRAATRAEGQDR